MHFNLSWSLMGALVILPQTIAFPSTFTQAGPFELSSVLKAINVRDFEHAAGVRRRSEEKLSDLNLQTQSQLIYGRPGGWFEDIDSQMRISDISQHKISLYWLT